MLFLILIHVVTPFSEAYNISFFIILIVLLIGIRLFYRIKNNDIDGGYKIV